ncbi:uncharacterized protein LOC143043825 [Mytilus galloprovincialis]|uniref:uncharacterized protein LOC143043825 n=1 Tax=Mytilus galloprovincialis TaxID=29158 RepID=UPI003F7C1B4C
MVLPRQPIDETKNAFGDYLLDFLRDAKCCMLNGRGQKNKDNFTYVSPQGRSVVDYMIVPYGELTKVSNFEVRLVSDLVIDYNIQLSSNVRLPDHSILTCVIHLSEYEEINKLSETIHHSSNTISGNTFNRKYNMSTIPRDIFNSERCVRSLQSIIDSMLHRNNIENRINTIYERLVKTLHDEMDEYMEYTDFNESTNKRKRNIGKPYWNAELQQLLLETNKTEKEFLKFKGDRRIRKQLENNYKLKRREFDKRLRQEERKYTTERLNRIKTMNTSNPKEFWREINKLGPGKENTKIDCVVLNEGGYSNDPNIILGRWKEEYAKLFSGNSNEANNELIDEIEKLNARWEQELSNIDIETGIENEHIANEINDQISLEETKQALRSVKLGKAVGIDNLPNEILRNDNLTNVLHELYNTCFCNGIVPDVWCQNIIQPLLKKGKDYRDPLSYRCISLMSTVAKVFSHILNKRLVKYIEENDLLSEEQNGFRKLRSCLDHIFTLCTILRNRKTMNMDTYLCFIDFSKAFDSVNHTLLWNKLLSNGIHGNFYRTIRNMYSKLQSVVRISRNTLTNWFSVDAGVRHNLAPTLFALFINSLIPEINNLHKGINIGDDMVSCLLYADDLVIMSDSADGLQSQLDSLHKWTKDHLMTVNYDKSKVMHIRKTTVNQCGHTFMFGDKTLELTSKYRYLGLVICEHTDFTTATHELLTAGSRALGSLTSKYYNMGNMDYDTYTKIYDSTVSPILEYASAVWGFKKYNPLERLQYRAIRTFLGVGKHAPLPAIT